MASRVRQRAESVDNATPVVPLSRLNDARYNLAAMIQDNDFSGCQTIWERIWQGKVPVRDSSNPC